MSKIISIMLLVILLMGLLGLLSRKVLKWVAILVVFGFLCREAFYLYKVGFVADTSSAYNFLQSFVSGRFKYVKNESFNVEASPECFLTILSRSGNIKISSWDKEIVRVNAEKKARTKQELENIKVVVKKENDNSITINDSASFESDKRIKGQVHYEIKVPKRLLSISIETRSGNVKIENLQSNVNVQTLSGNIHMISVTGNLNLNVTSGNTVLEHISGDVLIKNKSGNVKIIHASGTAKVDVMSGNIHMNGIEKAIEAHAKSGNITLKNVCCEVNASAHAGNITIYRAPQATGKIIAKTLSGYAKIFDSSGDVISKGKSIILK